MKKLIEKIREVNDKKRELSKKSIELEQDFTKIFCSDKFWKERICDIIQDSPTRSKYNYTRQDILENLYPRIKDIDFYDDKISFKVAINTSSYVPIWIETGFFDVERLTEQFNPKNEDLDKRVSRKEERIHNFKKEIEELQKMIKTEKEEITNLNSWKNARQS